MADYNKLIKIFMETLEFSDPVVLANKEHIQKASSIYPNDDSFYVKAKKKVEPHVGRSFISVTDERSFQAALRLHDENGKTGKVGVLNFADAVTPGGLVWHGETTQEECLCRCSNLYHAISQRNFQKKFYEKNMKNGALRGTDTLIYTPDCLVFKEDTLYPTLMPREKWRTVDIVTCAAPIDSPGTFTKDMMYLMHYFRAKNILRAFYCNRVYTVVTGAFGCGAFGNDPAIVSEAWRNAIAHLGEEDYWFDQIVFAIPKHAGPKSNYNVFKSTMEKKPVNV